MKLVVAAADNHIIDGVRGEKRIPAGADDCLVVRGPADVDDVLSVTLEEASIHTAAFNETTDLQRMKLAIEVAYVPQCHRLRSGGDKTGGRWKRKRTKSKNQEDMR